VGPRAFGYDFDYKSALAGRDTLARP